MEMTLWHKVMEIMSLFNVMEIEVVIMSLHSGNDKEFINWYLIW